MAVIINGRDLTIEQVISVCRHHEKVELAPEAVEALLAHCFTELGAERVWCAYFDGNEKSRRCQEKCGFRFHHTERDVHWAATDEIKTEHYSILTRAEWLARQKPED